MGSVRVYMYMRMGAAQWQVVSAGFAFQHGPCLGATHAAPSSENRNEETQSLSLADGTILSIGLHFPRSRVNFEIWDLHAHASLPVISSMSFEG